MTACVVCFFNEIWRINYEYLNEFINEFSGPKEDGGGDSSRVLRSSMANGEWRTGRQSPRGALNIEAPILQPQRHADLAVNAAAALVFSRQGMGFGSGYPGGRG